MAAMIVRVWRTWFKKGAERIQFLQPEEKANWKEYCCSLELELGSSQRWIVKEKPMDTGCNMGKFKTIQLPKNLLQGWSNTWTAALKCSSHPWRYLNPMGIRSWASYSNCTWSEHGGGDYVTCGGPFHPIWFYETLPLKILPKPLKSIWSEQLKTTTYFPRAFPMSFVVSVLPVPAGPAGAPPMFIPKAWAKVI